MKEDHSHLNVPYGLFTVVKTGGCYQIEAMTTYIDTYLQVECSGRGQSQAQGGMRIAALIYIPRLLVHAWQAPQIGALFLPVGLVSPST